MIFKKYTIVAVPDVGNISEYILTNYIDEYDVIVESFIATSYKRALEKFQYSLNTYEQISIPVEKYNFIEVKKKNKYINQRDIQSQYWNSIKVAANNHNHLVLRERYSKIRETAIAKINKNEIMRKKLTGLDYYSLRNVYEKARSSSFLILRELAFTDNPYTNWMVLDIGDAFHNHYPLNDDSHPYNKDIINDLLYYEIWIFTLMELEDQREFHHIIHTSHSLTISKIIADLQIQNGRKINV
jgi:hypothetical protein